ncbi:MAG: VWA domain-containing protein [Gammaproteobacteria bacterium]|nr:VWA domain-containing protein [Gammaproteobacteria bacterium]
MLSFAWPWLFLLLPLPLLCRKFMSAAKSDREAALRVPFLEDFTAADNTGRTLRRPRWRLWLALLAWLLLVVAGARPQWLGEALQLPLSGRDLMLAVDLSGSMQERDFIIDGERVDRLTATKWVAGDFIQRRAGDRIGLILFGDRAYLQTPLTFDRRTVKTLLDEAAIGLAGKQTAIGDAIGLAVKRLTERNSQSRVLILLTDGANTAGEVEPEKAAELAARSGLKIYTIGIGADRMTVRSLFGTQVINPSKELNEQLLITVADTTGGRYFRAKNSEELVQIYQLLDRLEPVEQETRLFRPVKALYPWPLATALLLAALLLTAPLIREHRS